MKGDRIVCRGGYFDDGVSPVIGSHRDVISVIAAETDPSADHVCHHHRTTSLANITTTSLDNINISSLANNIINMVGYFKRQRVNTTIINVM